MIRHSAYQDYLKLNVAYNLKEPLKKRIGKSAAKNYYTSKPLKSPLKRVSTISCRISRSKQASISTSIPDQLLSVFTIANRSQNITIHFHHISPQYCDHSCLFQSQECPSLPSPEHCPTSTSPAQGDRLCVIGRPLRHNARKLFTRAKEYLSTANRYHSPLRMTKCLANQPRLSALPCSGHCKSGFLPAINCICKISDLGLGALIELNTVQFAACDIKHGNGRLRMCG